MNELVVAALLLLVRNGEPCATIVAKEPDLFAARELSTALEQVTGAVLPIAPAAKGPRVVLHSGAGEGDGFRIDTRGEEVLIEGESQRGTLFGVYFLLEEYVGCRWFLPGDLGAVLPRKATVSLPEIHRVCRPAFALRSFSLRGGEHAPLWGLRNGLNGIYNNDFAEAHGWPVTFQPTARGFHGFEAVLPAREYFPKYPEIFPLIKGKRQPYSIVSGQLCTTNPKSVELCTQVVLGYFAKHPQAKAFTLSPNDGFGWCECPQCLEFDRKYGGDRKWRGRDEPVTTDRLIHFLNQVAARLKEKHPDKKLYTLSYVSYVEPPLTLRPAENVVVFQCHYAPACYGHAVADASCPENREFDAHLKRWIEVAPNNLGIYAYTEKSMWMGLPRPVVRQMAADIRHYHKLGVRYYYAQSGAGSTAQALPLHWITCRLLWDPSRDVDALLDEFWQGYFAEAAAPMRAFYETFERSVRERSAHYSDSARTQAPGFITLDALREARAHLDAAERTAATDPVKQRVLAVRQWYDTASDLGELFALHDRYVDAADPALLPRLRELYAAQVKRWPESSYEGRVVRGVADLAGDPWQVTWSGFGEPMQLGGRECRNTDETGLGDNAAGWATLVFLVEDPTQPVRLALRVWGKSQLTDLSICREGKGKGRAAGGVWLPLRPREPLSGKEQWDELVVDLSPEVMDLSTRRQIVGMGGADSQIWIAEAKAEPEKD